MKETNQVNEGKSCNKNKRRRIKKEASYLPSVLYEGNRKELEGKTYLMELLEGFKVTCTDDSDYSITDRYAMGIFTNREGLLFSGEMDNKLFMQCVGMTVITCCKYTFDVDAGIAGVFSNRVSVIEDKIAEDTYIAMRDGKRKQSALYQKLAEQKEEYRKFLSDFIAKKPSAESVRQGLERNFITSGYRRFVNEGRDFMQYRLEGNPHVIGLFVQGVWQSTMACIAAVSGNDSKYYSQQGVEDNAYSSFNTWEEIKEFVGNCIERYMEVCLLIKHINKHPDSDFVTTKKTVEIFVSTVNDGIVSYLGRNVTIASDTFNFLIDLVGLDTILSLPNVLVYDFDDEKVLDANSTGFENHDKGIIFGNRVYDVALSIAESIAKSKSPEEALARMNIKIEEQGA